MSPVDFLSALWDDITGKDANGRSAKEKRQYVILLIVLLMIVTTILGVVFWPAAIVTGIICLWKIKIHLTNTY